jgi:hypothetical protein
VTARRDEHGQVTLLVIGFAAILLMAVVTVVDASAAYLQRQGLGNLADGAALHGADLGSAGVYAEGLPEDRLLQEAAAVRAAVHDYLRASGAPQRYPGIEAAVAVDRADRTVTVILRAPLDLPLMVPGWSTAPVVGASSTAAVTVQAAP